MYIYKVYGLTIASDMEFLQLIQMPPEFQGTIDVTIKKGVIPDVVLEKERQKINYDFGSDFSYLCNKTCRFIVENGRSITYMLKEGKSAMSLSTFILGYGLSMLALQRGQLAIHCSAISKDGKACLICGEPGAGKSTVTSVLLKQGWKLMADDMAVVDTRDGITYVHPAFPYQKLCKDAAISQGYCLEEEIYIDEYKDKYLVRYKDEFSTEEKPLVNLIYLVIGDENSNVERKEISGLDSFYVCTENLFLRKLLREKKYQPGIGQLALKMAGSIAIKQVIRPYGKDTLTEIIDCIQTIVSE